MLMTSTLPVLPSFHHCPSCRSRLCTLSLKTLDTFQGEAKAGVKRLLQVRNNADSTDKVLINQLTAMLYADGIRRNAPGKKCKADKEAEEESSMSALNTAPKTAKKARDTAEEAVARSDDAGQEQPPAITTCKHGTGGKKK